MPVNGQTIGKDTSVTFVFNGTPITIGPNAITEFESMPVTSEEVRLGLDGFGRTAVYPESWKGSFNVDRLDTTVDTFWDAYENAYYSGQNTGSGTINETTRNPDGSVSNYRFTGVSYVLETTGNKVANKVVAQRLRFLASRRLKS